MENKTLPQFIYHLDPISSGSITKSDAICECCGQTPGLLYAGVVYAVENVEAVCPWCIANGSAAEKFSATFFDAYFCDDDDNPIDMSRGDYHAVFGCTIGFATYNPIGWWVHCGTPAEYVTRDEPYDMIFECRKCGLRHTIEDLD